MRGDAAEALGIHPRATVRITVTHCDWANEWPHSSIDVTPDAVIVRNPLTGGALVNYPYSAYELQDGVWHFTGTIEDFTIEPGRLEVPSMDTSLPERRP